MKKTHLFSSLLLAFFCVSCSTNSEIIDGVVYDQKVPDPKYICTEATCTEPATYFFSSKDGQTGTQTFEYGDPLGHSFGEYKGNRDETYDNDGTQTARCVRCGVTDTKDAPGSAISKTGSIHNFTFKNLEFGYNDYAYGVSSFQQYYGDDRDSHSYIPATYDGHTILGIGHSTFKNSEIIEKVYLPSTLTRIGPEAFYCARQLNEIILPASLTEIGYRAFYGTKGLTTITIPKSVEDIGANCFQGYEGDIYCEAEEQPSGWYEWCKPKTAQKVVWGVVKSGVYDGFRYAVSKIQGISAVTVTTGQSSENLVIPNTIENVNVTTLSNYAFIGCKDIKMVKLPSNLKTIQTQAFNGCSNLERVIIPASVIEMEYSVFAFCSKASIYCEATSQPSGWSETWNEYTEGSSIYWYSDTMNSDGNHWHYVNDNPVVW